MSADGLPRDEVARRLDAVERDHNVRVLYAVESGSRAWGFASKDSDVDVRFLYVHRPAWYLSIQPGRDVIEAPIVDEIDLSGWDLRKALGLFLKSNPPLMEWLRSPLVYREDAARIGALRALVPAVYNARAAFHHYLHMAESNRRAELLKERIRHKKYFYVLRPVLACRWIEQEPDAPPPMDFESLAAAHLPTGAVADEVTALLAAKRAGTEADAGPPLPAIHAFLTDEIGRLNDVAATLPRPTPDVAPLDAFFLDTLREVWP